MTLRQPGDYLNKLFDEYDDRAAAMLMRVGAEFRWVGGVMSGDVVSMDCDDGVRWYRDGIANGRALKLAVELKDSAMCHDMETGLVSWSFAVIGIDAPDLLEEVDTDVWVWADSADVARYFDLLGQRIVKKTPFLLAKVAEWATARI